MCLRPGTRIILVKKAYIPVPRRENNAEYYVHLFKITIQNMVSFALVFPKDHTTLIFVVCIPDPSSSTSSVWEGYDYRLTVHDTRSIVFFYYIISWLAYT